jgi:isoleucyl-tRNA synthetase
VDWKTTLNLPKTEFPMRADLAKREPAWLKRWEDERQYARILEARLRDEATPFVLHDGPPYPTGGIHYGTVLNKVLKDIIVRSQLLMGRRVVFRPGWDCHGLPIEQQVEKDLGKGKEKKDELSAADFRQRCQAHALKFVDVMRAEFKRLGCLGQWDDPYLTLSREYEATVVRQLADFTRRGLIYRDKKPVHWCTVHRTALAEAEVEYEEHSSPSIYVRFPLEGDLGVVDAKLAGHPASFVIWTTTPWTLPANLAIVANPELDYVALPVDLPPAGAGQLPPAGAGQLPPAGAGQLPPAGDAGGAARRELLVVAAGLAESFLAACKLDCPRDRWIPLSKEGFARLLGAGYRHALGIARAHDAAFRLYFARHATLEAGTGLVHTAPGHGADDYVVGRAVGLPIYAPVDGAGKLTADVAGFAGLHVFDANPKIVARLAETGHLLNRAGESLRHQYPCCWRCKTPIVFRATDQWFARLGAAEDPSSLRSEALAEIARTQWIPTWGENRIRGMIEARPDWCLSRQRVWGVPIPAFRCGGCGKDLLDARVMDHVAEIFAGEGSNAWFTRPARDLLPPGVGCAGCGGSQMEKQGDIVDVWFESGVSWAAVCEGKLVARGEKVDLYLEGADQHRGWFHSSLLTAVATRHQAPYKAVLTHGWVLDERGKVFSKSEIARQKAAGAKGMTDYIDPGIWMEKNGAELLRLWTAAADYQNDIVFSQTILNQLGESYRKIRNTCRYLLSNLYDFVPARDGLEDQYLRELDLLALGVLRERDHQVFEAYRRYALHDVVRLLTDAVITMSAEYLDPVKDALYCEAPGSPVRRSVQTALYEMVRTIATWMAPILCFTAQDVADELGRATGVTFDVHGGVRDEQAPAGRAMKNPNKRWLDEIRPRREAILGRLEAFRAAGHKSLEAAVTVKPTAAERPHWEWNREHLVELCVVSRVELLPDNAAAETEIAIGEASGPECPRCWRRTGETSGNRHDANLCRRCSAVVDQLASEGKIS